MNVRIDHPTDRPNFTEVTIGDTTLWFSYKTLIAFHTLESGTVARENAWGPTTGKHLNYVQPSKANRFDAHTFQMLVERYVTVTTETLNDAAL